MSKFEVQKWEEVKGKIDNGLVFLELVTDWCGDCRMMKPVVSKVYDKYKDNQDIKFYMVNVEEAGLYKNPDAKFNVTRIPTHILLKDGEIIQQHIEYAPATMFEEWIDKEISK